MRRTTTNLASLNDSDTFVRSMTFRNSKYGDQPIPSVSKPRGEKLFAILGGNSSNDSFNSYRSVQQKTIGPSPSQNPDFEKRFNSIKSSSFKMQRTPVQTDPLSQVSDLGITPSERGIELKEQPSHSKTNSNLMSLSRSPSENASRQTALFDRLKQLREENEDPTINPFTQDENSTFGKAEGNTIIDDTEKIPPIDEPPPYTPSASLSKTAASAAPEIGSGLISAESIADPLQTIASGLTSGAALAFGAASRATADNLSQSPTVGNKIAAQNLSSDSQNRMTSSLIGGDLGSLLGPLGTVTGAVLGGVLGGTQNRKMASTSGDLDPSSNMANIY